MVTRVGRSAGGGEHEIRHGCVVASEDQIKAAAERDSAVAGKARESRVAPSGTGAEVIGAMRRLSCFVAPAVGSMLTMSLKTIILICALPASPMARSGRTPNTNWPSGVRELIGRVNRPLRGSLQRARSSARAIAGSIVARPEPVNENEFGIGRRC